MAPSHSLICGIFMIGVSLSRWRLDFPKRSSYTYFALMATFPISCSGWETFARKTGTLTCRSTSCFFYSISKATLYQFYEMGSSTNRTICQLLMWLRRATLRDWCRKVGLKCIIKRDQIICERSRTLNIWGEENI